MSCLSEICWPSLFWKAFKLSPQSSRNFLSFFCKEAFSDLSELILFTIAFTSSAVSSSYFLERWITVFLFWFISSWIFLYSSSFTIIFPCSDFNCLSISLTSITVLVFMSSSKVFMTFFNVSFALIIKSFIILIAFALLLIISEQIFSPKIIFWVLSGLKLLFETLPRSRIFFEISISSTVSLFTSSSDILLSSSFLDISSFFLFKISISGLPCKDWESTFLVKAS